jgi:hypothetical protein
VVARRDRVWLGAVALIAYIVLFNVRPATRKQ